MKVSEIARNLSADSLRELTGDGWLNAKEAPFSIHGLAVAEKGDMFRRMPRDVAKNTGESVDRLNTYTAGGRVRFRTNSPYIAIKSVTIDEDIMPNITATGQAGFDLYISDGGTYTFAGPYMPEQRDKGFSGRVYTDGKMHTYTLYMSLYAPVHELYIGLAPDEELEPPEPYTYESPVVYFGSSITHGCCASRPGNAYPSMISRKLDCEFVNLGFAGACLGQQTVVEYVTTLNPMVFVCDYDYNALDVPFLENTHFNLYETFRKVHPKTPYIMVSKPDYKEKKPGDKERREIIMASYEKALAMGDRHVYFVDGSHLFDGEFRECCTVDNAHPNDLGFAHMARGIGAVVEQAIIEWE